MFRLLIEQFKFLIFIMETQAIYFYVETKNPVWNLMEFIFFFLLLSNCQCSIIEQKANLNAEAWKNNSHERIFYK